MSDSRASVESTSSSLLHRVQANEPAAWRRFTDLYGPLVYHWVRSAGLQPADTADVVQEIFRAVAVGIVGFRQTGDGHFRGWLRTIAQNKITDHFRRSRSQPAGTGGTDAQRRLLDIAGAIDQDSPQTASQQIVRRALDLIQSEFEPHTWQAFWRTAMDEQRPADVATELGISVASVYQAKSRVLRRLRDELTGLL